VGCLCAVFKRARPSPELELGTGAARTLEQNPWNLGAQRLETGATPGNWEQRAQGPWETPEPLGDARTWEPWEHKAPGNWGTRPRTPGAWNWNWEHRDTRTQNRTCTGLETQHMAHSAAPGGTGAGTGQGTGAGAQGTGDWRH
jgi:hypothetical protein